MCATPVRSKDFWLFFFSLVMVSLMSCLLTPKKGSWPTCFPLPATLNKMFPVSGARRWIYCQIPMDYRRGDLSVRASLLGSLHPSLTFPAGYWYIDRNNDSSAIEAHYVLHTSPSNHICMLSLIFNRPLRYSRTKFGSSSSLCSHICDLTLTSLLLPPTHHMCERGRLIS